MDDDRTGILQSTRRHFFSRCSMGLGQMALASLLSDGRLLKANPQASHPLAPKAPHFPAKVRSIIYLYMVGGPSQLDLFDYKPRLQELDGQTFTMSKVSSRLNSGSGSREIEKR